MSVGATDHTTGDTDMKISPNMQAALNYLAAKGAILLSYDQKFLPETWEALMDRKLITFSREPELASYWVLTDAGKALVSSAGADAPAEAAAPAHAACGRCGRKLTTAKSIATGYGPTCARKVAADVAGYSPEQTAKAVRLVAAGAVVRVPSRRFHALHEVRGAYATYRTTTTDCTCQGAAEHGGCYHQLAVRLTVASPAAAAPAARYVTAA